MIEFTFDEEGNIVLPEGFSVMKAMKELYKTNESRTKLNDQVGELKEHIDNLEIAIRAHMDLEENEGMTMVSSGALTASKTETDLPTIEDWEAFEKFVYRNSGIHFLQRRLSSRAYRDFLTMNEGKKIPGIKTFTKKGISIRKNQYKR